MTPPPPLPTVTHRIVPDDHLHQCVCGDWHPGSFFAALPAAAQPALLHEKRLAQALVNTAEARADEAWHPEIQAAQIAAEYARLSQPPAEPTDR